MLEQDVGTIAEVLAKRCRLFALPERFLLLVSRHGDSSFINLCSKYSAPSLRTMGKFMDK